MKEKNEIEFEIADFHIVNSAETLRDYLEYAVQIYTHYRYVVFQKVKIGKLRTLPQNALFHVWLREFIAQKLKKKPREVEPCEVAGIKRTVKKIAYVHTRAAFLHHEIMDYETGEKKRDYTSSADWSRGEMYQVLSLFQMFAAEQDVILESVGEFQRLQEEENK